MKNMRGLIDPMTIGILLVLAGMCLTAIVAAG